MTNKCSKCGNDVDRTRWNGKRNQSYCKKCHALYMREHRPKHSELSEEARKKANTRAYTKMLVKRGKLSSEPCCKCGSEESELHHFDYSDPKDILWICRKCHLQLHHETFQAPTS